MANSKTKDVIIHNRLFTVQQDEFLVDKITWSPLQIYNDLSILDREIALLRDIFYSLGNSSLSILECTHGGYIPISLAIDQLYNHITILQSQTNIDNLQNNTRRHNLDNKVHIIDKISDIPSVSILYVSPGISLHEKSIIDNPIIICSSVLTELSSYKKLFWGTNRYVYINQDIWSKFLEQFSYCINQEQFTYDNLVNICIMVKNAGPQFKHMLTQNLPFADQWTILDTGSSDNTLDIVREVLTGKKVHIYQEPFINFRESRNRLLELAGHSCAFNIMLDDTYILHGKLREFLTMARTDDVMDSYSLFIKTDVLYSSNRISKPSRKLKYIYRIHEILEPNSNGTIPVEISFLTDEISNYMTERTSARKLQDLQFLLEDLEQEPNNSRLLYYIAETYLCLKLWKEAYDYYKQRTLFDGNREETQDCFYKMAFIGDTYLGSDWSITHTLYLKSFELNPHRAEPLFMVGSHYLNNNQTELAWIYMKQAATKTIPKTDCMNIKAQIYIQHLPSALLQLCYTYDDYALGYKCAQSLIDSRNSIIPANEGLQATSTRWLSIFGLLSQTVNSPSKIRPSTKTIVCFVIPGGWDAWNGDTLRSRGLGGSETFAIMFAEGIAKDNRYSMLMFCNCQKQSIINGVEYHPLETYTSFICKNQVDICFVHRYIEYAPLSIKQNVPTYIILHDLLRDGEIIPISPLLKGVLCISDWHSNYVRQSFPQLASIVQTISYGINLAPFNNLISTHPKRPFSFIYPSFPNRGLLQLLRMFPKITQRYPRATLNIFCNLNHNFVQNLYPQDMKEISQLLSEQFNVYNHGWVNGDILRMYWSEAQIWLYPCTYRETCCMIAFEAAASNTLAITNDLAALNESVGNRGIIIPGNPDTSAWQDLALDKVFKVLDNIEDPTPLIEANSLWIEGKKYDTVVPQFIKRFLP